MATRRQQRRSNQSQSAGVTPQMPALPTNHGENGDKLTTADEHALDKAWSTVTDKQMADSIAFTERMQRLRKQQQQKGSK